MKTREVTMNEILSMLSAARGSDLHLRFIYETYIYDAGVRTENGVSEFYFDDESYPSMLSFKSNVCVEGVAVCDFKDKLRLCVEE